jgi:hypothetical protein
MSRRIFALAASMQRLPSPFAASPEEPAGITAIRFLRRRAFKNFSSSDGCDALHQHPDLLSFFYLYFPAEGIAEEDGGRKRLAVDQDWTPGGLRGTGYSYTSTPTGSGAIVMDNRVMYTIIAITTVTTGTMFLIG